MRLRRFSGVVASGLIALSATACQTIDGAASAPSDQVSAYRADESASAAVRADADATALCQQAIVSMASMVGQYNAFIKSLNASHDYAKLRGADVRAREKLASGANEIRPKLTVDVPSELAIPVQQFLAAGATLNNLIASKASAQFNSVATAWTAERRTIVDKCGKHLAVASTVPSAPTSAPASPKPSTAPGR